MNKILLSGFIVFFVTNVFSADENQVLALKCFDKATGDHRQIVKQLLESFDNDNCKFILSADKSTSTYKCKYSQSEFVNCNSKSPKIERLATTPNYTQEESESCFFKAGIKTKELKGSNCFFSASQSGNSAYHVCDEYYSSLSDCKTKKPKIDQLQVDTKAVINSFPSSLNAPTSWELEIARKCSEASKVTFDLGPHLELCQIEAYEYSKFDFEKLHSESLTRIYDKLLNSIEQEPAIPKAKKSSLLSFFSNDDDSKKFKPIALHAKCLNHREVFIPKCDLNKILDVSNLKKHFNEVINTSRSGKVPASSGSVSQPVGTKVIER